VTEDGIRSEQQLRLSHYRYRGGHGPHGRAAARRARRRRVTPSGDDTGDTIYN